MSKKKKNQDGDSQPYFGYTIEDMNNEIWITIEQVMDCFKISKSTVYRLSKNHALPSCKMGNIRVYPKNLINRIFILQSLRTMKGGNKFNLD